MILYGDIYPTRCMEKTTDMFQRLRFWLPQNLPFYVKIYAAGRASKVELLMLVLDFKVDYRLKNTQRYFYRMHGKS